MKTKQQIIDILKQNQKDKIIFNTCKFFKRKNIEIDFILQNIIKNSDIVYNEPWAELAYDLIQKYPEDKNIMNAVLKATIKNSKSKEGFHDTWGQWVVGTLIKYYAQDSKIMKIVYTALKNVALTNHYSYYWKRYAALPFFQNRVNLPEENINEIAKLYKY